MIAILVYNILADKGTEIYNFEKVDFSLTITALQEEQDMIKFRCR